MMDDATPRTVSVVGEGRVTVAPDVATVMIGIETTEAALAVAQAENARLSAALRARLRALGLPERDIQTASFNVGQDFGRDGPTGFRVSNNVRVVVRAINRVGEILDAAIAAGANRVHQVGFGLTDEAAALRGAREAAMRDARDRAEQYAALAGLRLGEALSIAEAGAAAPPQPRMMAMRAMRETAATPIEPGEGAIAATIHVTYALLPGPVGGRDDTPKRG